MFSAEKPDRNAIEAVYFQKPIDGGRTIQVAACLTKTGSQAPHFSVTGTVLDPKRRDRVESIGAIHETILEHCPEFAPLVALHLASREGVPLYALENGFYFAGGTEWNGKGDASPPNATLLASTLRIQHDEAQRLVDEVTSGVMDKAAFAAFCETQKPRWAAEAQAGIETLRAGGPAAVPNTPAP